MVGSAFSRPNMYLVKAREINTGVPGRIQGCEKTLSQKLRWRYPYAIVIEHMTGKEWNEHLDIGLKHESYRSALMFRSPLFASTFERTLQRV